MKKDWLHYRMTSDNEPDEHELALLMHEVAVDAEIKSKNARLVLNQRIKTQITEALIREGFISQ